ncbi:hypothetical protein LAZ67_22000595 [Cordylochernes scorpioides]|uniref:Uncharacterized protein n=1 Tax=Cordylochernes scorpioides TaxID=51811 RepID=A0ABY6LNE5_9ARAC|nr:hypothetical protein LAZ67_22000595 [Cordylochernes scorpioides]
MTLKGKRFSSSSELIENMTEELNKLRKNDFELAFQQIFSRWKKCVVYGEKCMDIKNVRKWCREFNEGRINVHDEQRSGRPSLPESTVARIDEMVRANRRITIEEIEHGLN